MPAELSHLAAPSGLRRAVAAWLGRALCRPSRRRMVLLGALVALAASGATAVAAPSSPHTATHVGPYVLSRYADDGVIAYGQATYRGAPLGGVTSPVVAMAAAPDGNGYWVVGANGRVYAYGSAHFAGPYHPMHFASPVVAIAATVDGLGYWVVTAAGGVYAYGDAVNYGSKVQQRVTSPIVSVTATPDGHGYWLLTATGGVEAFGDAHWFGGLRSRGLTGAVGLGSSSDGQGYWIATATGTVAAFGDAPTLAPSGGAAIVGAQPGTASVSVTGIAVAPGGLGYWLLATNGMVEAFGSAAWLGDNSASLPVEPDAAIVSAPGHAGYWLLEPDAFPTNFANPAGGSHLGRAIVAAAAARIAGDPDAGLFCNAYGPCEAWCSLFATWAWEAAGVNISRYAFTGYVYDWAAYATGVLGPQSRPQPGDAVLYGTGPWSTATSVHVGIVAQVWPDGFIDTIEGDAGPADYGHYGVVINGPYLPSQSSLYNGVGIYGYALP